MSSYQKALRDFGIVLILVGIVMAILHNHPKQMFIVEMIVCGCWAIYPHVMNYIDSKKRKS